MQFRDFNKQKLKCQRAEQSYRLRSVYKNNIMKQE